MKLFNSQGSKRGEMQRAITLSSKITTLRLTWTLAVVLAFSVLHLSPPSLSLVHLKAGLCLLRYSSTENNKYWHFILMATFPSNFKRHRLSSTYCREISPVWFKDSVIDELPCFSRTSINNYFTFNFFFF